MSEHIVKSYGEELMELGRKIAEMGGLSETMLSNAIQALVRGDTDLAQRVIETDHRLDVLERDVEEKAILTIAKRQPMAVDLRAIVSSIRLASDMERIGDLSKNIAKRVVAINGQFAPQKIVGGVVHMSELALDRLKRVCLGRDLPDAGACAHFDRATKGGEDMRQAQRLLPAAVAAVLGKSDERDVASLFSPGGTHALAGEFAGSNDFEVVAFLVVLAEEPA